MLDLDTLNSASRWRCRPQIEGRRAVQVCVVVDPCVVLYRGKLVYPRPICFQEEVVNGLSCICSSLLLADSLLPREAESGESSSRRRFSVFLFGPDLLIRSWPPHHWRMRPPLLDAPMVSVDRDFADVREHVLLAR